MTPASVGVKETLLVLGKHSGKHAVESRLRGLGVSLSPEQIEDVTARVKALAVENPGLGVKRQIERTDDAGADRDHPAASAARFVDRGDRRGADLVALGERQSRVEPGVSGRRQPRGVHHVGLAVHVVGPSSVPREQQGPRLS